MKLYFTPGACSLAAHIALIDVGLAFDAEAVDIRSKRTASGSNFYDINPKGYVPTLVIDDGQTITENIAILDWIAEQYPALRPNGPLPRTRLLEMLAFISTEVHHAFKPFWHGGAEVEKQKASEKIAGLFQLAATQMQGAYLFGDTLSVADCYLFVTLRWAERFGVTVPEALLRLQWRMEQRPSVQAALNREAASGQKAPSRPSAVVRDNPEQHRFERPIHNGALATAYYREEGDRLVFIHTEVPVEFSGQGIGSELARGALDLVRQSGRKAILTCPFMAYFFTTHPEYADVVDG
jgi:glutathione S-transferase